ATGGSGGTGGATGGSGGTGGATGGSGGSGGASGSGGSAGSGAAGKGGSAGSGGAGGAKDAGPGGDSGGGGCSMAMITALISGNHGHTLAIPMADITAGVDKTYNARGTATHDHFVQLTATDFAALKTGGSIIKKSCNGTDHEFVISCGAPSRQPATPTCSDECGLMMGMVCPP
ncbi:MAG TPA: hypothetical protein VK550_33660, partial [Polyangiaceae bacterium]|nr:hypothetical protein [Polyangiaceae bacterium]